jgi:hypothetical protein
LKPGEVRFLKNSDGSTVILKCLGQVPAVADKDFASEKPALLREAIGRKLERELPRLFEALRAEANPGLFLTAPSQEGQHPPGVGRNDRVPW